MIKYSVKPIREAGLEARWTRTQLDAPIIVARKPKTLTWWAVDKTMWDRAQSIGIVKAFEEHTLLGDIFSVSL